MMFHFHTKNLHRGFTLIEMMVVIAVFVMLTTVTMANYRNVDNTIGLETEATKIAVSIRQAQISGTSVQENRNISDSETGFDARYGINFKMSSPQTYSLFANVGRGNGLQGSRMQAQDLIQTYYINPKYKIVGICFDKVRGNPSSKWSCDSAYATTADISFIRPNPESNIVVKNSKNTYFSGYTLPSQKNLVISNVEIILRSPSGAQKMIVIWTTGQVSVEAVPAS